MNETYRLSDRLAPRQFWISLGLTCLVLTGMTFKSVKGDKGAFNEYWAIALAGFAVLFYLRTYRQAKAVAASHSLTLEKVAIVIRDGAVEQRIPYEAIERLHVRKSLFGHISFELKGSGISATPFYGYNNMERLVLALSQHIPSNRITGKRLHV